MNDRTKEPAASHLVLLPGLGADERMYAPQKAVFSNLEVPAWLSPEKNETLEHYGQRMAECVQSEPPYYLGGVSFGGMVALEMARHLKPEALFLISSCRSGKDLPKLSQVAARLQGMIPNSADEMLKTGFPFVSWKFGELKEDQEQMLLGMAKDAPMSFIRWAVRAIVDWEFAGDLHVPVHTIHGSADIIMPLKDLSPHQVVQGAGHFMSYTHSEEVNRFILERLG